MKSCDAYCPVCGKLNTGLDLEESGGWMECIRCKRDFQLCSKEDLKRIPALLFEPDTWQVRQAG